MLLLILWTFNQISYLGSYCIYFKNIWCFVIIRIFLNTLYSGVRTIAPRKIAFHPVRFRVWFKVSVRIRVGGQFTLGAIVLEPCIAIYIFIMLATMKTLSFKYCIFHLLWTNIFLLYKILRSSINDMTLDLL